MDITEYSNKGQIVVAGDLNSRTGNRPDYIENDFSLFNDDNDNDLDIPLPRYSEDKTTNRFGHYLLDLCKAVQLRIVNGRLFDDSCIGAYTCMTPTGSSSIDLVLTQNDYFKNFTSFSIHDFVEFSNHTPVTFSIKAYCRDTNNISRKTICYNWKEKLRDDFKNDLRGEINSFKEDLQNMSAEPNNQESIDAMVDYFTTFIASKGDKYFKKEISIDKKCMFESSIRPKKDKTKWYNQECKNKKFIVVESLKAFNKNKSNENREILYKCKKDYKYLCRKTKQKFNRDRCSKIEDLRKKKPKEFWNLFKKHKSASAMNISLDQFYEHFQNVAAESSLNEDEEVETFLKQFDDAKIENVNGTSNIFSELDKKNNNRRNQNCNIEIEKM